MQPIQNVQKKTGPTLLERDEHDLLGHVQLRSWCWHCVASRGVGQVHRRLLDTGRDVQLPEMVLDESEAVPYLALEDRRREAYFSTRLESKTSGYALAFPVGGRVQKVDSQEWQ